MALARLSVGIGKKGKAAPHAAYIAREGKYAKPDDDLEKLEFTGYGNMPEWAKTEPSFFWKMSDAHERQNGSAYREHVIALPRELKPEQRHDLILDWIEQELGDRHAYQYAIHNPTALDGGEQPHCHLMFSERTIDGISRDPDQYFKRYNSKNPEKGGSKKANTGMKPADRKADLIAQRERWEQTCNRHLEQAGSNATISMKSYKDQGIKLTPFNLPMNQFNNPKFKQIYLDKLGARSDCEKAIQECNELDVPKSIDRIAKQAERERLAKQERENSLALAARISAKLDEQARIQTQQAEQARIQTQQQAAKKARKLDTPTKAPKVKLGERLINELERLHQRHDLFADKLDSGTMRELEARAMIQNFFIATQHTCGELNIAKVPDKYDMEKYEKVYEAIDKLVGSVEQRLENVGLEDIKEQAQATDKLQAIRKILDAHTARIDAPAQPQQQPMPTNIMPRLR